MMMMMMMMKTMDDDDDCNFVICLPTEHLGVLKNLLKRVRAFQIELEFGSVGF